MGAVEDAVDSAANFIGPFLEKSAKDSEQSPPSEGTHLEADQLVDEALVHLQKINTADQAKDQDAPYDGSLVGVVYGLLDLVTALGILPFLSPGVAFGQRPRSVLAQSLTVSLSQDPNLLSKVLQVLIPISEQGGSGVQPLLTQRLMPDIISAVAELSFSPHTTDEWREIFQPQFEKILASISPSRLLPILTSFLQQGVPIWLRQRLSKELAMVPLRSHGVRHTIEFLSLSYLSKNSQMPQEGGKIPLPLEALTQASRLLSSVPKDMDPDAWFTQLAPQLWTLLDGTEGVELSRAAGQIIAGGILNKRATGAPGTIGWETFARPLLTAINPGPSPNMTLRQSTSDRVVVDERDLKLSLKRLATISSSWSHPGLIKRLLGPVLLSLWGLMGYAKSRRSLDALWADLPRAILLRYMTIACDPKQVDDIATNLFWDGESSWAFGPGSQGGVEIRARKQNSNDTTDMGGLLSRIGQLDGRVSALVSLLEDANIDDETAGAIFLCTAKRWLGKGRGNEASKPSLTHEKEMDPLSALADAKLSEAMVSKFKDKFARSPQHIIELTGQLLQDFVDEHKAKSKKDTGANKPTWATLGDIVKPRSQAPGTGAENDTESEDLISFSLSILNTVVTSPGFQHESSTSKLFAPVIPSLRYLSQDQPGAPLPPLITNASSNLLTLLQPTTAQQPQEDPLTEHRATLKTALTDLTSPEPPNRAWALSTLRKLIQDPVAFPLIDIPSITHLLLSVSIADDESYVHTAAIPVLVDLATRAPNPVLRIIIDAFIDIDERSLRLKKEQEIEQALDFRLRVGEVLNNFVLHDEYWVRGSNTSTRFSSLKAIVDAVLSIASRRGQRKQTQTKRFEIATLQRTQQEEGEAAWGGPIPNLLDPEGENPAEQADRDALLKIVQGWGDTGIEEDVRVRASALSILSVVMEKRLELLNQVNVDAGLQLVVQTLAMETSAEKAILRRAAVLVVMGLLKGMDALLEEGRESVAGLAMRQTEQIDMIIKWVRDSDGDEMVRGHAENVVEGLETWRMKKLFKVRDEQFKQLGPNLGLEGNLQGLNVSPVVQGAGGNGRKRLIVEEIE